MVPMKTKIINRNCTKLNKNKYQFKVNNLLNKFWNERTIDDIFL
jgi:hypothetical protein